MTIPNILPFLILIIALPYLCVSIYYRHKQNVLRERIVNDLLHEIGANNSAALDNYKETMLEYEKIDKKEKIVSWYSVVAIVALGCAFFILQR